MCIILISPAAESNFATRVCGADFASLAADLVKLTTTIEIGHYYLIRDAENNYHLIARSERSRFFNNKPTA